MDLSKFEEALDKALENITPEEIEKYFPSIPKGWHELSEKDLPQVPAMDAIEQGGIFIKMRHKNGSEDNIWVGADTYAWWMLVGKDCGYTHWFND